MIVAQRPVRLLGVLALLLGGWLATQAAPPQAITYEDVLKLLKARTNEADIRQRLEQSPTQFTLDAQQLAELRKAGASEGLVEYLQRNRNPVTRGSDIADFVVILDCSGSMRDKTPDGTSKMDAAKRVVSDFIRELPNGKRLAFIVYGHKLYGQDKQKGCQAVEAVLPLRELDDRIKTQLIDAVGRLEPLGWTPIATALEAAGKELASSNRMCQLILITDGMETCDGDPSRVAEELNQKLDLPGGIDIIGFGVDPKEKEAMQKLGKAAKGTFHTPEKANELGAAIKHAREEAERKAKDARPPRPRGGNARTTWRFDKGHFENTKGNTWTEKVGDETKRWTEVRRTENFIELTREVNGKEHSMRLYDDHASHRGPKEKEWEKVYNGKWDK